MHPQILYVTADGLLEPLGFSQVVRVIEGLSKLGWRYKVVSLEKPRDLARFDHVESVRTRLDRAGIEWRAIPYDLRGGPGGAAANELALCSVAVAEARRGAIAGIHARSYHGAFAAFSAWLSTAVPYLFDTRSYWFDERIEEGRWFTSPIRIGLARGIEHQLYANAAGIVTLTELHAADINQGTFGAVRGRKVACIPTSADFEVFHPRPVDACVRVPAELRAHLKGKLVLGIIGSINKSYLVDETLRLSNLILDQRPDSHLLVLSGQEDEYRRRLDAQGIASSRYTLARARHDEMPDWLSLIDWGFLLLEPSSAAKRASMPTKLGEFFASGVRPIQYGCNTEVREWVQRAGSGIVLPDVCPESLEVAARSVASRGQGAETALARTLTESHFSLRSAVTRYDQMLRSCFSR